MSEQPSGDIVVRCPAGYSAIGGSFRITDMDSVRAISATAPAGASGWRGAWQDMTPSDADLMRIWPEVAVTCMPNAAYATRIVRTYAEMAGPGPISATAHCPAGAQVVGGGAEVTPQTPGVVLTATAPEYVGAPGTAWVASAHELEPTGGQWVLQATAICLLP